MKLYPLGLVGESNYQPAIADSYVGQAIQICFERDNPFDALALRVENSYGKIIGYIPRSSWLRNAVHEEGRGCAGTIASINTANGDMLGVVIHITLSDNEIFERNYGTR